ncbi:CD1375 family protein [Gordonibacter urolithinfaciens]|nr:CD1375 family protein [Gordonibacter urolithinfaciens]
MIKVYYNLVKNGKWDIENVPDLWRGGVQVLLDADE